MTFYILLFVFIYTYYLISIVGMCLYKIHIDKNIKNLTIKKENQIQMGKKCERGD